jgi:hypothetical protein
MRLSDDMCLSEMISVSRRYSRSINLERDLGGAEPDHQGFKPPSLGCKPSNFSILRLVYLLCSRRAVVKAELGAVSSQLESNMT